MIADLLYVFASTRSTQVRKLNIVSIQYCVNDAATIKKSYEAVNRENYTTSFQKHPQFIVCRIQKKLIPCPIYKFTKSSLFQSFWKQGGQLLLGWDATTKSEWCEKDIFNAILHVSICPFQILPLYPWSKTGLSLVDNMAVVHCGPPVV